MSNQRYRNVYLDGCTHFCTATLVEYCQLLDNTPACRAMLAAWDRYRRRFDVKLHAYVVMPEHVHFAARGSADGVRLFAQYSLSQSANRIRAMLETRAARGETRALNLLRFVEARANGQSAVKVWKERFRAFPLDQDEPLLVKLDYIHNNPVRRGLVVTPDAWPWSSYGAYHGGSCPLPVDPLDDD